jgi:hypothetical protein
MRVLFLLLSTLMIFSGCVNKRGISMRYYDECNEYYDAQGYYHKDCSENMVDFPKSVQDKLEGKKVPTNDAEQRLF